MRCDGCNRGLIKDMIMAILEEEPSEMVLSVEIAEKIEAKFGKTIPQKNVGGCLRQLYNAGKVSRYGGANGSACAWALRGYRAKK